jgi:hypothetical protein
VHVQDMAKAALATGAHSEAIITANIRRFSVQSAPLSRPACGGSPPRLPGARRAPAGRAAHARHTQRPVATVPVGRNAGERMSQNFRGVVLDCCDSHVGEGDLAGVRL